jgi:hypothetical protein
LTGTTDARHDFFTGDHWHARNLHPEGAEARAGAEKDGLPVIATESDVGRVLIAVHDASEIKRNANRVSAAVARRTSARSGTPDDHKT